MAYQHQQFVYPTGQDTMFVQQQHMHYPAFHQPSMPLDTNLNSFGYPDFVDDSANGMYFGDYEDCNEVTTRPRLTKEQVEVLEGEFQRNPKPNSLLKKHLALHTSLTLPRVANWFQNRRAKAKQQRKQEEYENSQQQQSMPSKQNMHHQIEEQDDDDEDEEDEDIKHEGDIQNDIFGNVVAETSCERTSQLFQQDVKGDTTGAAARERGYASLQRALAAAKVAKLAAVPQPPTPTRAVHRPQAPYAEHKTSVNTQPFQTQELLQPHPHQQEWHEQSTARTLWEPSPCIPADMNFDFGFGSTESHASSETMQLPSPPESSSHGFVSPQAWESEVVTPTMRYASQNHYQSVQPSTFQMPCYVGSRRPSVADSLTNNFEGIAIASSVPQMSFQSSGPSETSEGSEGGLNLASRRRRPAPAALTSASLRSRSYGALTATSPTLRQGMTPPSTHTLRHAKSAGHSLNSHYAGIRKSSIPNRSPLNAATFVESEKLRELMAQKVADYSAKQPLTAINTSQMNIYGGQDHIQSPLSRRVHTAAHTTELPSRTQAHSPPITPFQPDFFPHTASMRAPSLHPQYANFADYTPPYSAGPLTNSSWSDAPITSPDLVTFPQNYSQNFIPSLPYSLPEDDQNSHAWMMPADQSPGRTSGATAENKETQFYIQKFPNQEAEHAKAARFLEGPRPKHYDWQNRGQNDYALSS